MGKASNHPFLNGRHRASFKCRAFLSFSRKRATRDEDGVMMRPPTASPATDFAAETVAAYYPPCTENRLAGFNTPGSPATDVCWSDLLTQKGGKFVGRWWLLAVV